MIIIRCDRCGTEDDLHSRTLEVSTIIPQLRTWDSDSEIHHLCGYCWSRVQLFITNRATHVVEDNS